MARQALPIVGAIVGAWLGAGNPYAIQFGAMIGSPVGESLDPRINDEELDDDHTERLD